MATAIGAVYTPFIENQITGPQVDFDTDTIKVMLVESGYTYSSAHEFRSSITNESVGDNYVAGGQVIANITISTISNTTNIFGDDSLWASTGGTPFSFAAAVIYKDTGNPATDLLVSYHDFGTTFDNNGTNVTLQWTTNAIVAYVATTVAAELIDLSDVNSSTPTNRNVLVADGVDWESRALVEADISDLQAYLTTETNDLTAAVTWANIPIANVPTGTTGTTVSLGNHQHVEADITDLQAYLTVEANDLSLAVVWANVPIANIPTGTTGVTVALGNHQHVEADITDLGAYIANVVEDTTPQLGGALDVQANAINTSTVNGDITLTPNGIGNVNLGTMEFNADQTIGVGQDNYVLTYDNGTGEISLEVTASTVNQLSDLSDVVSATNTNRFALLANGTTGYVGRALLEADISDLQAYLTSFTETNDLSTAVTWANIPIANVPTGTTSSTVALGDHTQLLASGATDVTATAAEVNLLDLAGLTAGWVLSADTAATASWKAAAGGASDNWLYANNGADFTVAPIATGTNSIAMGNNSSATALESIVIGESATDNLFNYAVVIGTDASVGSYNCLAIGRGANTGLSPGAIALGGNAAASADSSVAIGTGANADGIESTSIGWGAKTKGSYTIAIGTAAGSTVSYANSVAIGHNVVTTAANQLRIGTSNTEHLLYESSNLKLVGTNAQYVTPTYTTAGRPTPTTGGMVFDTTLGIPIWHDGTNWIDAAGTTV